MRKGPHPLSMHIAMAAAGHARENPAATGPDSPPEALSGMLLGIRKYQLYPYEAARLPLERVWEKGRASLSVIPQHSSGMDRPAVLLVPSLINKAYILDLLPERSLMRYLATQGFAPHLFDWGDSMGDPQQQNLDDAIGERLIPAMRHLAEGGGKFHALGYCMGGTVLAGAARKAQQFLRSLVFLAAPWDFHAGAQALLSRVQFWAPSALPVIHQKARLPVDLIQTLFASLDPALTAKKFSDFAAMEEGSEREKIFIAVEDWLNDGVDLPGDIAQQCIGWFLENAPARGQWRLCGTAVDPSRIRVPALVVASSRDRLVEYETASALQAAIPGAELLDPACGHIGMIAGSRAVEDVWKPLACWMKARA